MHPHRALSIVMAIAAGATALRSGADEPAAGLREPEPRQILFVNVDGALNDSAFDDAMTHATRLLRVHASAESIEASLVPTLAANPTALHERFGPQAVLAIFIENAPDGYAFVQAPRAWSMVNVHGIERDTPDEAILRGRLRKLFLKGLAHAAGVGSNPDRRCAMWSGSHTLEGMDQTSDTLGPYAFFPLEETLRALGGAALFVRPRLPLERK